MDCINTLKNLNPGQSRMNLTILSKVICDQLWVRVVVCLNKFKSYVNLFVKIDTNVAN